MLLAKGSPAKATSPRRRSLFLNLGAPRIRFDRPGRASTYFDHCRWEVTHETAQNRPVPVAGPAAGAGGSSDSDLCRAVRRRLRQSRRRSSRLEGERPEGPDLHRSWLHPMDLCGRRHHGHGEDPSPFPRSHPQQSRHLHGGRPHRGQQVLGLRAGARSPGDHPGHRPHRHHRLWP